MDKGGRGQKIQNFADFINGCSITSLASKYIEHVCTPFLEQVVTFACLLTDRPVEPPRGAEALGETGGRGGDAGGRLGRPVVVGGVARVERVVGGEGLRRHEAGELAAEAAGGHLAEVARRLDQVPLPLPPLGPPVLEPDLQINELSSFGRRHRGLAKFSTHHLLQLE